MFHLSLLGFIFSKLSTCVTRKMFSAGSCLEPWLWENLHVCKLSEMTPPAALQKQIHSRKFHKCTSSFNYKCAKKPWNMSKRGKGGEWFSELTFQNQIHWRGLLFQRNRVCWLNKRLVICSPGGLAGSRARSGPSSAAGWLVWKGVSADEEIPGRLSQQQLRVAMKRSCPKSFFNWQLAFSAWKDGSGEKSQWPWRHRAPGREQRAQPLVETYRRTRLWRGHLADMEELLCLRTSPSPSTHPPHTQSRH